MLCTLNYRNHILIVNRFLIVKRILIANVPKDAHAYYYTLSSRRGSPTNFCNVRRMQRLKGGFKAKDKSPILEYLSERKGIFVRTEKLITTASCSHNAFLYRICLSDSSHSCIVTAHVSYRSCIVYVYVSYTSMYHIRSCIVSVHVSYPFMHHIRFMNPKYSKLQQPLR